MGKPLAEAFRQHYMAQLKHLRYEMLRRAADVALGADAAEWFRSLGVGIADEYARALGSDAAMVKQLKVLEQGYIRPTGDDVA